MTESASDPISPRAVHKLLLDAAALGPAMSSGYEDRYRILRERGRGGMGVVFEALDEDLDRPVALKVLSPATQNDPEALERLRREAKAAARLHHPCVAAVYDAGPGWVAFELASGPTLAELRGRPVRDLVGWIRDAARAVQHAHEHGIIHRDLKPQNLMLHGDRVLVTDFGLASGLDLGASLTQTGDRFGTLAYMAPEQAEPGWRPIDPRTDVFGLAATLYDLLGGRPPHGSADATAILRSLSERDPPPLRSVAPHLPWDLATVVDHGLQREPAHRYPTAGAFADDLERWMEGRSVLARPPSLLRQMRRLVRRYPGASAATIAGVVAIASLIFAALASAERRAASEALRLQRLVETTIDDARVLREEGQVELATQRLAGSVDQTRRFLRAQDVPEAWFALGRLLAEQDQPMEAADAMGRAHRGDPEFLEAKLQEALLRLQTLSASRAVLSPTTGIHEAPADSPDGQAVRTWVATLEDTLPAVDLRRVDRLMVQAEMARARGRLGEARGLLDEVLRLSPLDRRARNALGWIELAHGNGFAAWGNALSAADVYLGLGAAYRRTDVPAPIPGHDGAWKLDGALDELSQGTSGITAQALAVGLRSLAHVRRGAALAVDERWTEAVMAWDDAIESADAALVLCPTARSIRNNRGVTHLLRARALRHLGHTAAADGALSEADQDLAEIVSGEDPHLLGWINRAWCDLRLAERLRELGQVELARDAIADAKSHLARSATAAPGAEPSRLDHLVRLWESSASDR